MFKKLAVLLLLLAIFFAHAEAAVCTSKSQTEKLGSCSVKFKVSGCLKGFLKWRYKATATETSSGLQGSHQWTKSAKGAAEGAAQNLFSKYPQLTAKCYGAEWALDTSEVWLDTTSPDTWQVDQEDGAEIMPMPIQW